MKKFDKYFFGLIIGSAFPFFLSLSSMVLWFSLNKIESMVFIYLCLGLLLGVLIDLKFLRSWINRIYELPIWFIILIYLIYNVGLFGFFMGFPVFNIILGFLSGYYYGKRLSVINLKPEKNSKIINQVSLFTGLVMALVCISSGFIALSDEGAGGDIQGMLGLSFGISKVMLLSVIIAGGFGLIAAEYFITKLTILKTIKLNNKSC